jgi:hypothetical protein
MYCVLAQVDSISGLHHCSCRRIVTGVNCFCNDFSSLFSIALSLIVFLCAFKEEISQKRISPVYFLRLALLFVKGTGDYGDFSRM